MVGGKIDSDVKLYVREVVDEIRSEIRTCHPQSKAGKLIQNNLSVIVTVLISAVYVVRDMTELRVEVSRNLPHAIETLKTEMHAEVQNEMRIRDQAEEANQRDRTRLLGELQKTDDILIRKVDSIIQVCCPKGTPIGIRSGENPTYCRLAEDG